MCTWNKSTGIFHNFVNHETLPSMHEDKHQHFSISSQIQVACLRTKDVASMKKYIVTMAGKICFAWLNSIYVWMYNHVNRCSYKLRLDLYFDIISYPCTQLDQEFKKQRRKVAKENWKVWIIALFSVGYRTQCIVLWFRQTVSSKVFTLVQKVNLKWARLQISQDLFQMGAVAVKTSTES